MYKIAICEDDAFIREDLRRLCDNILTDIHIEYSLSPFSTAEEVETALSSGFPFDLLILDIELGGKNGLELAKELRQQDNRISIIFVSSYENYLRDGYGVQPIHFLIKPVTREALTDAISTDLRLHRSHMPHINVRSGSRIVPVSSGDILYVEVMDHILHIHTRTEIIPSRSTLTGFLELLPTDIFCRCHNSFAVNLQQISNITHASISLKNGATLPIGRKYYDDFQKAFIRYMNS